MAWVTKDSVEQYETPESKKEYTKQEKAANWWYYHKLYVGIAVIAVVLVVWMVHDVVTRVRPDYRVGYVGSSNLPTDTVTALENTLAAYCDDRNGDGKVVVELVQYNLDFDSESENTDAYTQMADVTRLSADLSSKDGPYIFIMQDTDYAQQFAETTGDLQYLDGTMPRITYHFSDVDFAGRLEDGTPMFVMSLYDYWNNGITYELYLYVPGHETDELDHETWQPIRTPDRLFDLGDTGEHNIVATIHKATVTGGVSVQTEAAAEVVNPFCGFYQG